MSHKNVPLLGATDPFGHFLHVNIMFKEKT